jgi:MerR family transcriptional regulator, heat shock protein HspR
VSTQRSDPPGRRPAGVPADSQAVFAISIAAERADMQIQNLRVYERRGLLEPARTPGGTRLYSEADVRVLRRIAALLDEGLNLAGIRRVLALESEIAMLREQLGSGSGEDARPAPSSSHRSWRQGLDPGTRPR